MINRIVPRETSNRSLARPSVTPNLAQSSPPAPSFSANPASLNQVKALKHQILFGQQAAAKLTYEHAETKKDPVLGNIEIYRFSNGMELVAVEKKDVPLACFGVLVKTGAYNEKVRNNGVSHFLEHLIFKGTENLKPGEFDEKMADLGADINAWTYYDETFYYAYNIPKESLPEAIPLQLEVVQNALIPPEELERERSAVTEEIKRARNNVNQELYGKLTENLLADSPYRREVLGPIRNIETLSRDEIREYYNEFYAPHNRTVLVVGDFDLPAVLDSVARHGNKPFAPVTAKPNRKKLSTQTQQQQVVLHKPAIKTAQLGIGFEGPRRETTPDYERKMIAFELLGLILSGGDSSRLDHTLVEKEKAASSIGLWTHEFKHRSYMILRAQTQPETVEQTQNIISREIAKVAAEGITQEELETARTMIESRVAQTEETLQGLVYSLASTVSQNIFHRDYGNLLELARTITPAEIQSAAREFLSPEKAYTVTMLPKPPKASKNARASKSQNASAIKFGGKLGPLDQSEILPSGAEVIVREKPGSLKTAIAVQIRGGNRADSIPGETDILAELLERGTPSMNAEAIQKFLDSRGLVLEIRPEADTLTVLIEGLSRFKPDMLQLMQTLLSEGPTTAPEDLEQVKRLYREHYEATVDQNPQAVIHMNLIRAMYPEGHPYGNETSRIVKHLDEVTPDAIKALAKRLFVPNNITVALSGEVTMDEARKQTAEWLKNYSPANVSLTETPRLTVSQSTIQTQSREGLSQAEIMRGWYAPDVHQDEDKVPLAVLNTLLGYGLTSRLFQTFREKAEKALAYEIYTRYEPVESGGLFRFYIGTDPVNINKVLGMFQKEVDKLIETPVEERELKRTKIALKKSFLVSSQAAKSVAKYLTDHRGLNRTSHEELAEKIDAVTAADIQRIAKKILGQPSVTTVLAPKAALEAASLPVNSRETL